MVSGLALLILLQEACDDAFFGFFFGETQSSQLQDLFAGDLTDGGFVNQFGVDVVGFQSRERYHGTLFGQDGVTFGVTGALVVSDDGGLVELAGVAAGYGTGYQIHAGVFTVQSDHEIGICDFIAVGHQSFTDDETGAGS